MIKKEKTVLVNFRIPESIWNNFKDAVDLDPLTLNRTSAIIRLMNSESKRVEKLTKIKGGSNETK